MKHLIRKSVIRDDIANLIYSVPWEERLNSIFIMDEDTVVKLYDLYRRGHPYSPGPFNKTIPLRSELMELAKDYGIEPDEFLEGYIIRVDDVLCSELLKKIKHAPNDYNIFFGNYEDSHLHTDMETP